jgi:SAM-dependent methyltransferase
MNYKLAYRIGFHPWEDALHQQPFVASLSQLVEADERRREKPYGRALDLGTGSGIWAVELAKRGWDVTGIDLVDKALDRADERACEAGVSVRFLKADVTNLGMSRIGSNFRLLLDTGTFHGLAPAEREAMGRQVDEVAAPDATLLVLAWARRRRGPLPRGADCDEIAAAFPRWQVTDTRPTGFHAPKPLELLLQPDERWYQLRRP